MGDTADDAMEMEENWQYLKYLHITKRCDPDCPYCDPDFEPLFGFQALPWEFLDEEHR